MDGVMPYQAVHFRRCHVCGELNESSEKSVHTCTFCAKPLAPFVYFEDADVPVYGDRTLRPPRIKNEYFPIQGLTAYWESD